MRRFKNKKGFTLVELIVVIVIIAILAAILVPALLGYIDKAKKAKYLLAAKQIETAAKTTYIEAYAEDGNRIAVMKWNYTSNTQTSASGKHFCLLEAVYVYGQNNEMVLLNKDNSYAKKYFKNMMDLVETNDIYLSGTTWIFFDQSGNIVSNADHKIAGQGASTQLIFKDKAKKDLATVNFDDTNGWQVEWAK